MKTIEVKFTPGDMVYYSVSETKKVEIKCETCDGRGKIEIKDKDYKCPECKGDGYKVQYTRENKEEMFEVAEVCYDGFTVTYKLTRPGSDYIVYDEVYEKELRPVEI